jgi:beta-lactam-binding protein with PASTA domain
VPYGTEITIVGSLGPQPAILTPIVPNVVGLPALIAEQLVYSQQGLGVTNSLYQQDPGPSGIVLAQSPSPGPVPAGTNVTLTLSTTITPSFITGTTVVIPPTY